MDDGWRHTRDNHRTRAVCNIFRRRADTGVELGVELALELPNGAANKANSRGSHCSNKQTHKTIKDKQRTAHSSALHTLSLEAVFEWMHLLPQQPLSHYPIPFNCPRHLLPVASAFLIAYYTGLQHQPKYVTHEIFIMLKSTLCLIFPDYAFILSSGLLKLHGIGIKILKPSVTFQL